MKCQRQSLFVSLELSLLVIFNIIKVSLIHIMWKYTENSKAFYKVNVIINNINKKINSYTEFNRSIVFWNGSQEKEWIQRKIPLYLNFLRNNLCCRVMKILTFHQSNSYIY